MQGLWKTNFYSNWTYGLVLMVLNVNLSELRTVWTSFLTLRLKKSASTLETVLGCRGGTGSTFSDTGATGTRPRFHHHVCFASLPRTTEVSVIVYSAFSSVFIFGQHIRLEHRHRGLAKGPASCNVARFFLVMSPMTQSPPPPRPSLQTRHARSPASSCKKNSCFIFQWTH
jgi:hypothetical protein